MGGEFPGSRGLHGQAIHSPERIVIGTLLLGVALVAVAAMALYGMTVNGGHVPPDPLLSIGALALAAVTLVGCVWVAVRLLGRAEGLKVIRRELGAALWAGAIAGFLSGFAVRAVFPGPAAWLGLMIVYGAAAGLIYWLGAKRPTA